MKIAILGTGHVGSTIAYTLIMQGIGDALYLVNRNLQKARSDAIDLQHSQAFTEKSVPITAVGLDNPPEADLYILCLSVPYKSTFTSRFDLAPGNYQLFKSLIPKLKERNDQAIYLVVSNPVDVLCYFCQRLGKLSPKKVLGVGTLIDSARFRKSLSEQKGIHPDDIRAYILGEHGDSQFHALSIAYAGGEPITDEEESASLIRESVNMGYEIVKGKGYSNFAVSRATALIVESIYLDNHRTIPVSALVDGYLDTWDVYLSLPAVIGRQGIERLLHPQLSEKEQEAFRYSASVVKRVIEQIRKKTEG